ncbi:MAG TPA: GDP-mannose 4,6-dehydratase [Mycobacteriales bacterium]|nr:GDP-mannose 4,6-dehydratase [Mycobacteriales bacterium]
MTTALITGIAGQDGIYLTRLLQQKGYRVVGSVHSPDQARRAALYIGDAELVQLDITDGASVDAVIGEVRPDEIYNLAAYSSVGASWQQAERVAETNGMAVLRLLESLVRYRDRHGSAPRFYQASSSEIFGLAKQQPQDEGTPHHPRSPYAAAKSFAHHLTVNYRESYGLFACNGILFNHESPLRPTTFVTRKITRAVAEIHLGRRSELTLGNLDVRRDWGAAQDYVRAMWLMLQQPAASDYIIASGKSVSLRDFVDVAFACVGIDDAWSYVRQDPAMMRPADVPQTWGDPSKAERELGWSHTMTFTNVIEQMVWVDVERLQSGVEESPAFLDPSPVRPS